jgi:hypothetical protein
MFFNKFHYTNVLLFMFNYLLKGQNSLLEGMDFELTKDFKKAILDLNKSENLFYKKKLYFEAIFLDLTDRTESHPRTSFKMKDRGGLMSGIVKSIGLGNQKVVWELDNRFEPDYYFSTNWFDNSVEMYQNLKKELEISKNLYKEGKINFYDYFIKRLQVYNHTQPSKHIQLYKGVDINNYQNKLRDILEPILLLK